LLTLEEENNPLELLFNLGKTISNEFAKSYLVDSKYVRSHDEGSIFIHDLDYYVLGATFSTHLDLSFINDYDYYFESILKHLLCIKEEQCGEHSLTSIDYLFIFWLVASFKKIFKSNLFKYLELEGFLNYLNTLKLQEMIDKLDNIYFDIDIFKEFISSNKVKEIFNIAYNNSLKEIEELLKTKLKTLLKSLNEYDHKIKKDSNYIISLGSNKSNMGIFITKVYLEVIKELEGLENVTTVYKITNGKDLLLEDVSKLVTLGKNISFNYLNKSNVEYFSDGKRIWENVIDKKETSMGRSIISKVSINLVRIALESKNINEFYHNLDTMLEFAKNELLQAFEYLSSKYKKNYKYSFNEFITDEDKKIRKVIKSGTLDIGYSGLNEAIYILSNKNDVDIGDFKIATDIVKFMKFKSDKFIKEYKLNFTVFETVDKDVLSYFENIDKSIYGDVIKNKYEPFYKIFNKSKIKLEDCLKIETKIAKYSNGGYYEVINIPKNSSYKKVLEIINMAKEYELGYFKIIVGRLE
ncbi:MAG TPA: anaerobic ribonucleoside-triphosphate reductase, partial [Bacilli bacterium]|nr:anaerobic ribonucleoside-triphosphate reductase [Bacilli bacterium]